MKWLLIFTLIFFTSCNAKQKDKEELASLICDCAKPVLEWKDKLQSNPGLLMEGSNIEADVRDCLEAGKVFFKGYEKDTAFIYSIANEVNEICPKANTTVNAMLLILSSEK